MGVVGGPLEAFTHRLYLKCRILKHHAHRYLLPVCDRRAPVVVFRARRRARLSVRTAGFLSSDFTRTLRLLTSRVVVLVNPLVRARTAVCPKARPLTVCFHCSCEVCVRRYRTNNHTSHLRNKGCHKERVDLNRNRAARTRTRRLSALARRPRGTAKKRQPASGFHRSESEKERREWHVPALLALLEFTFRRRV